LITQHAHDVQGNIVVCTDREITLWSVNGDLLASNGSLRPTEPITAVECGHGQEWEPHNIVYVTGHADGSIEVWRVPFFVACAACV
jgi:WD40 repeat protein